MADVEIRGKISVDTGNSAKSVNEMLESIKQTKAALKDAKVGSDEYKAAQKSLESQTKELNQTLDKSGGSFGKLKNTLGEVVPGFQGATQGAAGLGKQLWLLVANPIVAVIAGIVVVFTLLYNVLKNFDPVMDAIEQGFNAVKAVVGSLMDAVLQLVTGAKNLSETFTGLGSSMKQAANEAIEFTKVQQDLDDLILKSTVNQSKYNRQINELILQSKDRTKTEAERVKLIDQALGIEEKAFLERKRIADDEVRIAQGAIIQGKNLTAEQKKQLKEKGVDYAISLKDTKRVTDDEIATLAGALAKQEDILNQSITLREKALNRKYALQDAEVAKDAEMQQKAEAAKTAADAKKIADDKKKSDAEQAARVAKAKTEKDEQDLNIQAVADLTAADLAIKTSADLEKEAIAQKEIERAGFQVKMNEYAHEISKRIAAEEVALKQAQYQEVETIMNNAMAVFGKNTMAGKALAVANALMNTYSGATDALRAKSTLPSPFDVVAKVANVAMVLATGFKSVKAINSVQIPGGGGGSVAVPSISASAPLSPQQSSTSLNAGSIQGVGNAAAGGVNRTFVLDADIKSNQERQARISRAARLG